MCDGANPHPGVGAVNVLLGTPGDGGMLRKLLDGFAHLVDVHMLHGKIDGTHDVSLQRPYSLP